MALRKLIALGCCSALIGAGSAYDMADMEIYVDYQVGLWDFASEGTLDRLNTEQVHSYFHSVKIGLNANKTATMYHTWYGEYTQNVTKLAFWIYSNSSRLPDLTFQARIKGEAPRPAIRLGDHVTLTPGQWNYVELPLQTFHVVPGEILHYTYFKAPEAMTFWIDDASLITRTPLPITQLVIDPFTVKSQLTNKSFGVGINARDRAFDEIPETAVMMRDAGITFLNFPGGLNANLYDWRTSLSKLDGSLYRVNTQDYLTTSAIIGAEPMITANYGSGTPQEAADWVYYANVELGGNVKYWTLGNECYHPQMYDVRPPPFNHDAETYGIFAVEAIQLMKAVDPTIQVGVSVVYNEYSFPQRISVINPVTNEEVNGWTPVLLTTMRERGVLPDFLDFHLYTMAPGKESDRVAFQMVDRMDFWVGGMRKMISDYFGAAGQGIDVKLTESNSVWGTQGKMSVSLTNALYLAHHWGMLNYLDVKSHIWWKLHDEYRQTGNYHPSLYGWREHSDWGILGSAWPPSSPIPVNHPYPTYYALRMINQFADPGDEVVEVQAENMLLKTYAVRTPQGRVRLMVINISKTSDITATINILGQPTPQFATVHRYGVPHDAMEMDYTTQVVYGGAATWGVGSPRGFTARFNRYSITVIEL